MVVASSPEPLPPGRRLLPVGLGGAVGGAIVLALVGPLVARRRPGVDGGVRPVREVVAVSGS